MRRLFFDIETSYSIGWFWGTSYNTQVFKNQIITPSKFICIGYKWQGSNKIECLEWERGDDEKMIKKFLKVIEQADEVVAHNGDRFDIPKFRTRCVILGIEAIPHIKSIDTLLIARNKFKFESNKLNDIANDLGLGSKHETGIDLWHDVIQKNCKKAMKRMVEYCKRDVELLEKVFLKLEGYARPKTHVGINSGGTDKCDCQYCGEHKTHVLKYDTTVNGTVKPQLKCTACKKYFYSTMKAVDERRALKSHKNGLII